MNRNYIILVVLRVEFYITKTSRMLESPFFFNLKPQKQGQSLEKTGQLKGMYFISTYNAFSLLPVGTGSKLTAVWNSKKPNPTLFSFHSTPAIHVPIVTYVLDSCTEFYK